MKKRILTVALVLALLATCFAGTYAYLQDSEAQVNTFTVGNVTITLDEVIAVKNTTTGNLDAGTERTEANQQYTGEKKLFPGMTVAKDPTITVDTTSEEAWIAAKITVTNGYDLMNLATKTGALFDGTADVVVADDTIYVYVKVAKTAGQKVTLFHELKIPADWDYEDMAAINGMTITVDAYGVQANGFANCEAAMKAAFPNAFPAN